MEGGSVRFGRLFYSWAQSLAWLVAGKEKIVDVDDYDMCIDMIE